MAEDLTNLIPKGRVPVVDRSGRLGTVGQGDLKSVLAEGFSLPDNQTLHEALIEKKYGGFSGELKSALAGAGRGATFGLSDLALTKTGLVSPETLEGLKEANPVASGIGEGAGILGSSLLVPGGGLVGGVSKVSTSAAERIVPGAIENAIAKKIAEKTVAGALEGAFYGAGQSVSESALGDPTLNAQKVFSNIGLGALFGGVLSGGVTAVGAGLSGAGKLFNKISPETKAANEVPTGLGTQAGVSEGAIEGTVKPATEVKLEGTIDFGMPDEKVVETAAKLNPKNPLNINDLEDLKKYGLPDAEGKPTVFKLIGTNEVPTLDPMAQGQVHVEDVVKQGMKNLSAERTRLDNMADQALESTLMPNGQPLSVSKGVYRKFFTQVMDDIKSSGLLAEPPGKRAYEAIKTWADGAAKKPDMIPATDLRDTLQRLRTEMKLYTGGDSLVKQKLREAQGLIDDYLKDNSEAYKNVQKEFAPFTKKSIELEDHLNWNWEKNDSDLVSDWASNRIAKPFNTNLPGTKGDADLIRWFSKYAGVDLERASKVNLIYGKLNPESAMAGQLGSWGSRMVSGVEAAASALKHPSEIPGKVLGGAAKVVLTGEMPEFYVNMKTREIQSMLLGNASPKSAGVVSRIAKAIEEASNRGSSIIKAAESVPVGGLGAALGLDIHSNLDDAERRLNTLFAIERATIAADKKIQASVKSIFNSEPIQAQSNKKLNEFLNEGPKKHSEEWDKLTNEVRAIANNPDLAIDKLSKSLEGMDEAVPQITAGINAVATRAVSFLSQKLILPDSRPLDGKFVPSKDMISKAARYLRTINNPYVALDELKNGNFTKETKEVLSQVYPELYDHLKVSVMDGITKMQAEGKVIPKNKRLGLSYFLDQPLESGLNQFTISKNYATMLPQQGGNVGGGGSQKKSSTLPSRLLTPMQKVMQR
jgi:hypothetical protein